MIALGWPLLFAVSPCIAFGTAIWISIILLYEPKKLSWLCISCAILLVYPLSMPPALVWAINHGHIGSVQPYSYYEPMYRLNRQYRANRQVMSLYGSIRDVSFIPPEKRAGKK
jgi:hypothetical protein